MPSIHPPAFQRPARAPLTLAALLAGLPLPASADDARDEAAEQGPRLEEVIASARREDRSLHDTAAAVTVLSGAALRETGSTNLMQVGAFSPNVSMATGQAGSGAGQSGQVYIRGVGQVDFLFTTDPGVGIYVDGVYHPRTVGAVMDLLDLERVEIVRGPQGTLFGKNAIGGAINVITTKPSDAQEGWAELTVGSLDRRELRGSFNSPIAPQKLLVRAAVSLMDRDGYGRRLDFATGAETDEAGDDHRRAVRAALRWLPTERLSLDLSMDYARESQNALPNKLLQFDDAGDFGGVPRALWNALVGGPMGLPMSSAFVTADPDTSYATGPNRNALEHGGLSLTIEKAVDDLLLKSITAYRDMDAVFGRDGDGSPLPYVQTHNTQHGRHVSQEVQLFGDFGRRGGQWLTGLFYFNERGDDSNEVRLASGLYPALEALPAQVDGSPCGAPFVAPGCPGNPVNVLFDFDLDVFNGIENESVAAYAHGSLPLTERLSLSAGVRYTRDEKRYRLRHVRPASGLSLVPPSSLVGDWTATTPTAALELRWSPRLLTYVSASRGFKSGGFNGRPIVSIAEAEPFDPEFVWSYELGAKVESARRRVRLNAATFVSDYEDLQFTATSFDPDSGTLLVVVDNVGRARIRGIELELEARPLPGLAVGAGLGHTDFEIRAIDDRVVDVTLQTKQPRTPEWTGSINVRYAWPWGDARRMSVRVDWAYESESFADMANTASIARSEHSLVNARLALEQLDSGWEIALSGTNLTDRRVIVNGAAALASFGSADGFYNRPREWALSARKRFR